MDDLYRLAYYSSNRMTGSPDEMADSIRTILEAARRKNIRAGVTGALMFNRGSFAQVLEGPREAVSHTFERIQQDERHGAVTLLAFETVPERSFDNWSMAFVGALTADVLSYGGIAGESAYDPSRMNAETLFQILHSRVLEEETPA